MSNEKPTPKNTPQKNGAGRVTGGACPNCDGLGEVIWDDDKFHHEDLCHVCGGSGTVNPANDAVK